MRSTISAKYVGDGEFRRYYLHNNVGQYWNGQDWVYRQDEALLYESLTLCHEDYQRLITIGYENKPVQQFTALLQIVVRSDQPVTRKQLRRWLLRAFQGLVDTDACGDGPVPGSLVIMRANFNHLKEVRAKPANDEGY